MRVPSDVIGRTKPSRTGLAEMKIDMPEGAFGGQIARGMGAVAGGLLQVGAQYEREERYETAKLEQETKQREAEAKRIEGQSRNFKLETAFVAEKTGLETAVLEESQKLDPSAQGWHERSLAMVADREKRFFEANPDMTEVEKAEYRYKFSSVRAAKSEEALRFQMAQNQKFVLGTISSQVDQAKTGVDQNPDSINDRKTELWEAIDKSTLTPVQKLEQKKVAERQLQLAYGLRKSIQARISSASTGAPNIANADPNVVQIVDQAAATHGIDRDVARRFAMIESSMKPDARSETGASGLFQFTEDTWKRFGKGDRMDPIANAEAFGRLYNANKAELAGALGREPTPGEVYLAHQQGSGGAKALLSRPNENVVDALVNGGAYRNRESALKAIVVNGGNSGMTAGEFASKWLKKFDGSAVALAGSELQNDPNMSALTYEDRIAIQGTAETQANQFIAQQTAAAKAQQQAYLNDTLIKVDEGKYSAMDFDRDKELGRWDDSSSRERVESAIDARDKEALESRQASAFFQSGQVARGTEDDNKMMNKIYADHMADRISQSDPNIVSQQILPFIAEKQDIPTNLASHLTNMSRSNNQSQAKYAYEAMAAMQQTSPHAFSKRFTDSEEALVNRYRDLKGILPEDELFKRLNPVGDPQVVKAQDDLRKRAKEYLSAEKGGSDDKLPNADELFHEVLRGKYGLYADQNWLPGDQSYGQDPQFAPQKMAMQRELNALFTEEFVYDADPAKATLRSIERLKKTWTSTDLGGRNYVMKDAPETTGAYRPLIAPGDSEPSHKWIDAQVRREYGIKPDTPFELVSDDQTRDDIERRQRWSSAISQWEKNPRGPKPPEPAPPSYRVAIFDRGDVVRMDGRRINFEPTAADIAEDTKATAYQQAEKARSRREVELVKAATIARDAGTEVDPEFREKVDDAKALSEALRPSAPVIEDPEKKIIDRAKPLRKRQPEIR